MEQQLNPYAAPSQTLHQPPEIVRRMTGRFRLWLAQIFAVILVAGSVPASALAMWDIETIIGSGGLFLLVSIVLIFLCLSRCLRLLIPIALVMLMIIGGIVFAINWNHWSPTDAQKPIGYATIVSATVMQMGWLPIVLVGFRYKRASVELGEAQAAADV